ncbi:MAG: amylo-alpha-1,6-glucosidase [Anaerolineae bacterium]|jgi:predicted glycogen debranching enzyme
MPLSFGRDCCSKLCCAGEREWLITNGIGGYASGTIAGLLTRRYHGLLIAALNPPLGRTLLVAKCDDVVTYDGRLYPLFANRWRDGSVEPAGFHHLENFRLEGTTPVWSFACADALLEKRIWMQPGANITYVRYELRRARVAMNLSIKCLANCRDHHGNTRAEELQMRAELVSCGLQVEAPGRSVVFHVLSDRAEVVPHGDWIEGFHLSVEAYRGLDAVDDHLHAGTFCATLSAGESLTLVASTSASPNLDGESAYEERRVYEQGLIEMADRRRPRGLGEDREEIRQLLLAADQFVVRRPLPGDAEGCSMIAGYPWFGDWGRDTMISLPGLTLVTGRSEVAARILRTFAHFVDRGMLPNRFPDAGEAPEYNTADATLWYFEAIRDYYEATRDTALVRELFPVLQDIIEWHRKGTRYNIHLDEADGLLYAGEEGVQLTWMDAKVQDWVVTPRIGKPVEINALWYNALRIMIDFAHLVGEPSEQYINLSEHAAAGFCRFWNEMKGYCYDVLDGPDGDDAGAGAGTLRPNQLFAVSLPYSPLTAEQQRAVVDACERHLLTPHGLRSLAPEHPAYIGQYGGNWQQRDAAYHQGTVWGWLIGPFVRAHLRVHRDPDRSRSYLEPLLRHLKGHGVGSISEIFDGDPPFTPRGCIAQAWSVAEVLCAWHATDQESGPPKIA